MTLKCLWGEADSVDWWYRADIYMCVCRHPHQGAPTSWNPVTLYTLMYEKLAHRIGFPRGELLHCPIFVQDKIVYLHALPRLL